MSGRIFIIGVGGQGLTTLQKEILADCSLIVSGKRHLELLEGMVAEILSITPWDGVMERIKQHFPRYSVGVLASGDPLFFGIARKILATTDPQQITIMPALSSMQEACARFKIPWDDINIVSLHGREQTHLARLLLHPKTFIFTDWKNSPEKIAAQLLAYLDLIDAVKLKQSCIIHVGENLGTDKERLVSGSLADIAAQTFGDLNVMLLTCPEAKTGGSGCFGLCQEEIVHSRGLITKDEVRAVTLHKLQLPSFGVMWDIGAGSGSVSLEAARMNPGLVVYAIERTDEGITNIKNNIRRFGSYNIVPVRGSAPAVLQGLPTPERIFVGGSGDQLSTIISHGAGRLSAGGRLVVNGVLAKTIKEAPQLMHAHNLSVSMSTIQCERRNFTREESGTSLNPIAVIVGKK